MLGLFFHYYLFSRAHLTAIMRYNFILCLRHRKSLQSMKSNIIWVQHVRFLFAVFGIRKCEWTYITCTQSVIVCEVIYLIYFFIFSFYSNYFLITITMRARYQHPNEFISGHNWLIFFKKNLFYVLYCVANRLRMSLVFT